MEGGPVLEVVEAPVDSDDAILANAPLPDALPVLPLRETVTFPDTMTPLAVGQERSIKLVNDVLGANRMLVMVASRDPENEEPGPEDLHDVGVVGVVARMMKIPDGTLRILVQGTQRVELGSYVAEQPYLVARISEMPDDDVEESPELEALTRNVQRTFSEIIEQIPYLPEELQLAVANIDEPAALGYLIAGALRISTEEKQELLEETDVVVRLRRLAQILNRELEVVQLGTQIQSQVQSEVDKGQREFLLRQQMKAIQDELGEGDEEQAEINELREQIEAAELPEHARKAADRELSRLEKLPPAAAEHGVIRTYLEWLVELPWSKQTEDNLDIAHAREVLDADHYDLEKVKDRILEYLAVRKLNPDSPGPILCFVGPPGVGKTSLGRSIAKALGREFERISVGGVRDEAEIRGHRRTYIGALPGTIVRALRDAGSRNPVFMIDELDKMGADFRGDPASAMLEVFDPAQNDSFRDHYLDLEFDLSDVLFIATANVLDTIPGPLQDRMETIELAGYTLDEKTHIARRYLVPRQVKANGLKPSQIEFADPALAAIVEEYTREAGVRGLERQIGTVCRKIAREVAEGKVKSKVKISAKRARELLGRRRVFAEQRRRTKDPGCRDGAGLDADRRRRPLYRGDGDARLGRADDHRPARRRDERVGAGGALLRPRPLGGDRPRARREVVRRARHPHPRPGRGGPQGRPLGGGGDDGRPQLPDQRPAGQQPGGDDRGGDSDGAGAADRRPQGEVPCRAAGRDQAGDRPGAKRGRRRRDPRARAQRARVRLRRRGLQGDRGGAGLTSLREWAGARSKTFWVVAGITLGAAVLRFATLGVQSYHHDEIVTAGRVLGGTFSQAMDQVGNGESAPPLYYVLAWGWSQLAGTGEFGLRSLSALAGVATVPVAYLLGEELRGRRAGVAAAALVAVNPMLLWYSQEARAYSLFALLCAVSALYFVRALNRGRRSDMVLWGIASALALGTHYFAFFPVAAEALWLLRRRGREMVWGLGIVILTGLALAPLAHQQSAAGHAEWISTHAFGHRLWETGATFLVGETGDVIARPERLLPALVPFLLVLAALVLIVWRGRREDRRAASIPLAIALAAVGVPALLAVLVPSKDYVLARNLMAALVPLLAAVAIGVIHALGAPVRRRRRRRAIRLLARVLHPRLTSPALQRPDWDAVAAKLGDPVEPRAIVTWTLGQASVRHYLERRSFQTFPREEFRWLVHEIDFVSDGPAPPPSRDALGPRFRQVEYGPVGRLYLRRYELPGPDLAPLRLRQVRSADLGFGSNGVLIDGVGPG